jgi:hypothetical protein
VYACKPTTPACLFTVLCLIAASSMPSYRAADHAWRKHPITKKELAASSSTLLNSLRQTTCTATKACLSGGGGSTIPASKHVVVANAEVLPGAALAKMDGGTHYTIHVLLSLCVAAGCVYLPGS